MFCISVNFMILRIVTHHACCQSNMRCLSLDIFGVPSEAPDWPKRCPPEGVCGSKLHGFGSAMGQNIMFGPGGLLFSLFVFWCVFGETCNFWSFLLVRFRRNL